MKLRTCSPSCFARRRQRGMATMVVIALLSIIFIYVAANARTLHYLKRDLNLIEQRQTLRLKTIGSAPAVRAASAPAQTDTVKPAEAATTNAPATVPKQP